MKTFLKTYFANNLFVKNSFFLLLILVQILSTKGFSQTLSDNIIDQRDIEKLKTTQFVFDEDSARGFNEEAAWQQARMSSAPLWEQKIFVSRLKRNYINYKYEKNNLKIAAGVNPLPQAACTNVDFEAGTTAGWTMNEGMNTNSTTKAGCCPAATTRFSVVGPGFDPTVPALAKVPPGGGNFSLLLGDGSGWTGHAVRAKQTFVVSAANSIFVYRYAVVLEDAGHTCAEQPYFNIAFTDCSNNPIPCSDYNVVPTSATCPGGDATFVTSGVYKWKDWQTRSFDLTAYIGQCVTIQFIASDCTLGAHAGWAYVDCSCQAMTLNLNGADIPVGQTNNLLCSVGTNTLCAPPGFTSYSWTGPGVTGLSSQCINPSAVGSYSVTLGQAGAACLSPKLYSNFTLVPAPSSNFSFSATPCQNNLSIPFTSTVNLNGGPAVAYYHWDFNSDGVIDNTTANPVNTYSAYGTYTAQLQVSNGSCLNTINQVVTIQPTPTVNINSVPSICSGTCITLPGQAIQLTSGTTTTSPSFSAAPNAAISTVATSTTTSIINVTGLSSATLNSVCLNINHTWDGDLSIYLICPSGTTLALSNNNGSSGNNYTGTCFNTTSATNITAGTSPFSLAAGYAPQGGALSSLNACTMNGSWQLVIIDRSASDGGTFLNWTLSFTNVAPTTGTTTVSSFTWSPSVSSGGATLSPTVCPISSTVYTLTGTGSNGCTATNTVSVIVTTTTLSVTSPTICNGTSSPLSAGGASTYTWSPSTGLSATTGATVTASPTVTTIYTVTGTTASGCVGTQTTVVTVNPKPTATLSFTNPTCGNNNGVIFINNTSPALPAQTISTFASSLGSVSGQTITGLGASTPVITLTNNFGCTFTVSTTLTMTPGPTAFSLTPVNTTCGNNNGSLTFGAPVTSGTSPFTYSVNSVSASSPTTGLPVGTYSVTIKDANGCVLTQTTSITNISGPTAIAGTTTQASCNTNNGTFNVTGVTGGTSAYTYSVDAVSTGSLTSGLAAGTHTISVRDANGCVFSRTFAIGTANGPSSFTVTTTNSNCGLANGTSTLTGVTGGTPTYSYSFDGGGLTTVTTQSGLLAGTHTVIVKDANSCTITATYIVANNAPPTIAVTSSLNVLCNGASTGSLTVSPTGGTGPYTYTLSSPTQTNATGAFTGLVANAYSITVKDNFGCTATTSVTLTQPSMVTGTVSSIPVNCFGNSTGTVSAGGAGGVAPYNYLWPALSSSTLSTVGGVAAGSYSVTIKDANLCSITKTITVTQPASLTLTSTVTPATCGNTNGSGTVTVSGGTPVYSYNWSNGSLTNILTSASAGVYTITVQDLNGCIITNSVTITNIAGPTAISGTTTQASCNTNNGTFNVTGVTGGTSAYTYSVDAVSTGSLTSGLAAGTHTILVKDANSCSYNTTFIISTANGPSSFTVATTNANCGTANGTATLTGVTGGTPTYSYSFDGGAFLAATSTSGLLGGTHTVTVKDVNSCTLTATYLVSNNAAPTASISNFTNILCNGGSTGSFTVTPSGGISPYSYTLATPIQTNTTGIFSGLPAGLYNITVSDNSGCTATASVTLSQPTAVTLTVTGLPANCFSFATGTVSASGSGGVSPYTYLWPALGSSTLATVNNVLAGTYSVTQTDGNGCSITQSVIVTQPTSLTLTSTLTPATCGNSNGSGTVTVSGGTPAYTYSWSNSGITSNLSGAPAGTYTINVTDFKGCVLTKTLTVTNIPGPTAITGTTTLAGCGLSNGTYNVTGVTGGTSVYTYSLDGVSTTSLTSGLAAGTHTILVSDANSCTYNTTFNIGTTTGPVTASVISSNASCGTANGTSTVVGVTGGTSAYQYSFDGSSFAAVTTTSGLIAGTHSLTIKDANSCTLAVTYNVLNNGSPLASITSSTNTSCFAGTNGGFVISGSGGSGAPFSYTLTSPYQSNTTGVFNALSAGTYSVITGDNAGCTTSTTITITEPSLLAITPSSIPAKCFGALTGTINIVGAGGTSPYQYSLNGAGYQAGSSYTAVGAGIYNLSIKDFNGCISTQTVQVNQPPVLAIAVSSQNANCTAANGIATATVSGGTPIYTYSWTGGGGTSPISNPMISGNYTVTATDANNCVISSAAVIGLTPGGTATISALSNVTCNGASDGSLTSSPIGGAAPYTYLWSPGSQTVATAVNLSPGTYTCTITDFYGCKATAIGTITQPPVLTAIMNSNNVKCYGTATGTVSAAGSGGSSPYTYLWATIPSTLSTVPNVALGTYSCSITDANGCSIIQSITVTEPSSITLTSTVTPANCNQANGSATVTAFGGAPGAYTYSWTSGSTTTSQGSLLAGTYTILVQDANNCSQVVAAIIPNVAGPVISVASQTNVSCFGACDGVVTTSVSGGVSPYIYTWSNGNSSSIAPNLCAQIYTVSVTDHVGCVSSTSVNISQPTALTVNILPNNPKCFGSTNGFAIAAASGGTPSYTYSWTLGGNSATTTQLGAGNYGLTVKDANGCVLTTSVSLINPPAMAASITSTNVSCFGSCNGIAAATSTNGVGAVSYFWVGGASPISSQIANNLCAGTYTMLATDQNNCTASSQIIITEPAVLTANISSTGSVTCNGGNNGFAVVTPSGGTPTYSYSWSGVAGVNGNSANANTLPAGNYSVTVTDLKGCTFTTNTIIAEPAPLATTLTTTDVKCNGASDGTANVATSGGAGTTTFLWQPGLQSGNFVNNLSAGNQTVTITTNGACPTVLTFTLNQPAALTAVASASNSNCGQNNGNACATVGGGTSPLSYLWSNGPTTLCNSNIIAGAYTFTVIDFNGCVANASGLVNDISGPSVSITSFTNVSCFGASNGGATANIIGGVPNYTISWTGSQASANSNTMTTNFGAGLHNISVVDAAGCIGTASVNILQPSPFVSAIGSYTDVTCYGFSNGGATILINGGTSPFTYSWTPSSTQTNSLLVNVNAGVYSGLVTDANGCVTTSSVIIHQPQALVMSTSSFSNISCFGGSNGQIITTIQGGSPGYTYSWNPAQVGNSGIIGSLLAGGYSLTVTDSKACSINANYTIIEPSVLTSSYTSLPATCGLVNGSATVTVGGGTPTYTLNWNTAPTQQGAIATHMAPGNNWQCVITDLNGCTLTQTVSIANPPVPVITGFNVTPPSCFGLTNGDVTINYSAGTAPYTVSWSSPISQTITTSALTHSVAGIAAGAYSATVKDNYGCSTSLPVNVSQPGLLMLLVSPDPTICYGQTTQLSASGQSGTPAYTYTWLPNPFVGGGPQTVNPSSTTSYTVSVSDTKGCSPSPKVITVNVKPQLSAAGSSVTLCDGQGTTLTPVITSPGNGGAYTYVWTPVTGSLVSVPIIASAPLVSTTNTFAVTVSDGCSIPSASAIFTVIANPLPVATFTTDRFEACAPATINFTAVPNVAGNYTFEWFGNEKDPMGVGNPLSYNYAVADTFDVSLLITNTLTGCFNSIIKSNYIIIDPQPIASFYADPQTASILAPSINFINTSKGAVNYYWDFGDVNATNGSNNAIGTNTSHYYNVIGVYNVHLIAISNKGCKDTAMVPVEITPDFALYIPNAFTPDGNGRNDVFQPMGVGIDEENYRMDIFDRWGENIFTSNNFRKGWDGSVKGGSKLAEQGVYTYKILVRDVLGGNHPFVGHVTVIRKDN